MNYSLNDKDNLELDKILDTYELFKNYEVLNELRFSPRCNDFFIEDEEPSEKLQRILYVLNYENETLFIQGCVVSQLNKLLKLDVNKCNN